MRYWYDKEHKFIVCSPNSADEWMAQIWEVGCDYNGCDTVESLKKLIDELIEFSHEARYCLRDGKIFKDADNSEKSWFAAKLEQDKDRRGHNE